MDRRVKIGLGAAAAVLLAGGAALYAQERGPHGPMAHFDADGNGTITLAEARAGAAKMFAGADADKDGRVTMEEMRAFHGRMGGPHRGPPPGEGRDGPMHLDSDNDGAVTLAEAQGGIERHFGEIDSNKDGSITGAEIEAAHRAHHKR